MSSIKRTEEAEKFWAFVEQAAKKVDGWPSWMLHREEEKRKMTSKQIAKILAQIFYDGNTPGYLVTSSNIKKACRTVIISVSYIREELSDLGLWMLRANDEPETFLIVKQNSFPTVSQSDIKRTAATEKDTKK